MKYRRAEEDEAASDWENVAIVQLRIRPSVYDGIWTKTRPLRPHGNRVGWAQARIVIGDGTRKEGAKDA
jgi:hypothetical protein